MTYGAFGLVEVLGSANAVLVVDQMLKTADVEFRTWDTKCGGHATVFMSGDVAAVTSAVARVSAEPLCDVVTSAVISNPSEETIRLVEESAVRNGFAPEKEKEES
ncbi:BMC domain-containing protein [Lachnospiraceae bacterium 47-T17]